VICLILLGDFLVDWLWFSAIGYLNVFWTIIIAEAEVFFSVFLLPPARPTRETYQKIVAARATQDRHSPLFRRERHCGAGLSADADPCARGDRGADSDEVAQAFRDDVARRSEMMSPECDASVAADFWHSIAERSIVAGRVE
jgi:hypothetical protein